MGKRETQPPVLRLLLHVVALPVALSLSASCSGPSGDGDSHSIDNAVDPRPNIVLIMADDLGWGDVGYNESKYSVTPNLDGLAAHGVTLNRFYAAAPVCSPTRGSVLTGRHPYRYGIYYANVGHLPREEITIAELLKGHGYKTGFFGKWHLGTLTRDQLDANRGGRPQYADDYSPPVWHGFDRVFATESKTPTFDPMLKPTERFQPTWWDPIEAGEAVEDYGTRYWDENGDVVLEDMRGDDTRIIVDRASEFIKESAESGEPFLAVVWAHAPHLPVVASLEDQARVDSADAYTRNYFGSVYAMDREIGRLNSTLTRMGVVDNTIIWFMSDNGPEHLYEGAPGSAGPLRGTKRTLYEGGIRVPSVLSWPDRIRQPEVIDTPTVTSDVVPTLLDIIGIEYSDTRPLDGRSLKPLLSDGRTPTSPREIFFESAGRLALIGDRHKLVYHPDELIGGAQRTAEMRARGVSQHDTSTIDWTLFELYDLQSDPSESADMSAENEELVRSMTTRLERWRESVTNSLEGGDYD